MAEIEIRKTSRAERCGVAFVMISKIWSEFQENEPGEEEAWKLIEIIGSLQVEVNRCMWKLNDILFDGGNYPDMWIPCSKEMPKDEEIVLVTCATKKGVRNVNRAYYADGFWHGSGSMSQVVAWMPLPEPYRDW